jgi:hypothetical protein
MTVADLAVHLETAKDDATRWRLIAEFLEEYRHEEAEARGHLFLREPRSSGDERWDVLLVSRN